MRLQYKKFDIELLKNEYIKRHYECLPFIGEEYEDSRLLLIGESHYVPKNAVPYVDIDDFYELSYDDLEEGEYKSWINTRKVFERRVYDKCEFKGFFSNPATEIAKIINHTENPSKDQKISAMHQYAFFNYFKRPSFKAGKTIDNLTEKDNKFAYNISKDIIEVLKPELIIFISKKAYYAFCDSDQNNENELKLRYTIKKVSHPSSSWWNRKRNDGGCGGQDFYDYVSEILTDNN